MKSKLGSGRLFFGLVLSTAIISLALLPAVHAMLTAKANPSSGTIVNFPAVPLYQDFSSSLTVTGVKPSFGTPTWTAAPAPGSPSCANFIQVSFGNANAWNTTATFDDHSIFGCQATIVLTATPTDGPSASTSVAVTYEFCARCV